MLKTIRLRSWYYCETDLAVSGKESPKHFKGTVFIVSYCEKSGFFEAKKGKYCFFVKPCSLKEIKNRQKDKVCFAYEIAHEQCMAAGIRLSAAQEIKKQALEVWESIAEESFYITDGKASGIGIATNKIKKFRGIVDTILVEKQKHDKDFATETAILKQVSAKKSQRKEEKRKAIEKCPPKQTEWERQEEKLKKRELRALEKFEKGLTSSRLKNK